MGKGGVSAPLRDATSSRSALLRCALPASGRLLAGGRRLPRSALPGRCGLLARGDPLGRLPARRLASRRLLASRGLLAGRLACGRPLPSCGLPPGRLASRRLPGGGLPTCRLPGCGLLGCGLPTCRLAGRRLLGCRLPARRLASRRLPRGGPLPRGCLPCCHSRPPFLRDERRILRLRRHPFEAPPFPFAHPAPHAVPLIAAKRVVEALDPNGALRADAFGLPGRSPLFGEEDLRVVVSTPRPFLPWDVVMHAALPPKSHPCDSEGRTASLARGNFR